VSQEITETREKYTSVAIRGSILYFVIADMSRINDMYQNSLQFVKTLFNKAINEAAKSEDLEKRLEILIDKITKNIYSNISRGLFENDKLLFSYLIATSIDRYEKYISADGWNLILRGAQPVTKDQKEKKPANPLPKTISVLPYDLLYSAECMIENFDGIIAHMAENEEAWTKWATCDDPIEAKLPEDWSEKITDFQKKILLKVFRPEKLVFAFKKYVNERMDVYFTTPMPITMELLFNDIDPYTPLIFILSTGADPMAKVTKYAEEQKMTDDLGVISLGQGQGEKAKDLI
jgi:dynein heavy chain